MDERGFYTSQQTNCESLISADGRSVQTRTYCDIFCLTDERLFLVKKTCKIKKPVAFQQRMVTQNRSVSVVLVVTVFATAARSVER